MMKRCERMAVQGWVVMEKSLRFFTSHCSKQLLSPDLADVGCKCDAPRGAGELGMHFWFESWTWASQGDQFKTCF